MSPVYNKNISIIVAIAENRAIGKNNELLWRLSEDLKRFKKITTGHTVIMGRNTFLSLPKGALPNRTNLVISDVDGEQFENCVMASSVPQALAAVMDDEEAFVIGGGMVYKQFLTHATRLYLTLVHQSFEADTFFPEINYDEWSELERSYHKADEKNEFDHTFILYERKKG
ncbi:MAG: dihydrofolate reductase [Bacteroidales bacterium]|nr:dihydrofolate reductase [Bacteroidales bacterium]